MWQLINHIINKTNDKSCIIDYITVNNIEYHDTRDIANCFGKYYSRMGINLAQSINPKNPKNLSLQDYLSKIDPNPHSMYLHPISSIEIKNFIKKLPSKNSSGHDNISNNFLKKISDAIITPLQHIFNLSLSSGEFPQEIKLSEVIPLFKKGARDQMENYRLISLLITISKILEKCMYTRLYNFLDKHNIFYEKRYGFRKNHSCEQAIQNLCGHLLRNKDDGIKSVAIFLDLSKAFDSLSHTLLLKNTRLLWSTWPVQ